MDKLYADRAARTHWPAESSAEYKDALGRASAPHFSDVGKGAQIGTTAIMVWSLACVVLAVLAYLGWV